MNWMLRNSRGARDALLTFAAGAVAVSFAKVLTNGAAIGPVVFGTIDSGLVAALLAPTLGAYVAKRISGKDAPQAAPPADKGT